MISSSNIRNSKQLSGNKEGSKNEKEMSAVLSPGSHSRDVRGKVILLRDTFSNEFNLNVRGSTKLMKSKGLPEQRRASKSPKKKDSQGLQKLSPLNASISKSEVNHLLVQSDGANQVEASNVHSDASNPRDAASQ